jgi:hypothetical protein
MIIIPFFQYVHFIYVIYMFHLHVILSLPHCSLLYLIPIINYNDHQQYTCMYTCIYLSNIQCLFIYHCCYCYCCHFLLFFVYHIYHISYHNVMNVGVFNDYFNYKKKTYIHSVIRNYRSGSNANASEKRTS